MNNTTAEIRGSQVFYDSSEVLPYERSASNLDTKNIKAVTGVCVNSDDEDITTFNPRQTSTESEDSDEGDYHNTSERTQRESVNMDELVKSMALAFQTQTVQDSIRTALEPHFNKIIVSFDEYKIKTDDRIRTLEKEVEKIGPLEEKVNALQLMLEDQFDSYWTRRQRLLKRSMLDHRR